MNEKLHKRDALETMLHGFKGLFSAMQSRVSSLVSSLKSDLQHYNEKWEATLTTHSERISKIEHGDSSQTEGGTNTKLTFPKTYQWFKEVWTIIQTSLFNMKWSALDTVEKRVKSVAEDKFSMLKKALQSNLKEDLSAKVSAIQNTASASISEGINKLKMDLK